MDQSINHKLARSILDYAGIKPSASVSLYDTAAAMAEKLLGKQQGTASAQEFIEAHKGALRRWLRARRWEAKKASASGGRLR